MKFSLKFQIKEHLLNETLNEGAHEDVANDLFKLNTGILRTPKDSIPTDLSLIRLWKHECERVFADKLTTNKDKAAFMNQLIQQTTQLVGVMTEGTKPTRAGLEELGAKTTADTFFVDFLRDDVYDEDDVLIQAAPKIYEEGGDLLHLKERVAMFVAKYNEDKPAQKMNLVLFDDAMRHLMRITRCMGMPRGNMLLVGVGGSGKQSLTRLASYICGHDNFQIQVHKSYNMNSLMDDVRVLYKRCGQEGRCVSFLFTEAEIKDENFLEVINSILMTGEVTNLFPKDELQVKLARAGWREEGGSLLQIVDRGKKKKRIPYRSIMHIESSNFVYHHYIYKSNSFTYSMHLSANGGGAPALRLQRKPALSGHP